MSVASLTPSQISILKELAGGALGYYRDDVCVLLYLLFAEQDISLSDVLALEHAGLLVGGSMFEISDAGRQALAEWQASSSPQSL
ncbi:hypothetical protein E7T06_00725 [Deinococcus sp. Arct2-2]|uniref:hypothetical protein n=1 Tax=Deinococcus sp. Arct2-2 TaxID=2568653 RepID=UPI0010A3A577|nr:hypothetical protein [Deinococcus sp. Arct2-2]THF71923.1 hypothetical protein E7T06_00725 [Deinococcus sp. Arct2-2]